MIEHGLSPQQTERPLRQQCLFLRSLQQAEPVPGKRSAFRRVPVHLGWWRPFSFCVRQPFPAAALPPLGRSSALQGAQCSGRRPRRRLRLRSDPSLEKRRLQSADPLFLLHGLFSSLHRQKVVGIIFLDVKRLKKFQFLKKFAFSHRCKAFCGTCAAGKQRRWRCTGKGGYSLT